MYVSMQVPCHYMDVSEYIPLTEISAGPMVASLHAYLLDYIQYSLVEYVEHLDYRYVCR